ncbi:hypothetical protein R83H12_01562 [Fibrobacteria bacterium R8-3-H12]
MLFAKGVSKECISEFTSLPSKRNDFVLDNFLKDLPAEVLKTKAQMKLPFGKPKLDKITDIGISVGCLNAFPESPDELANMVKAVGVEITKKIMDLTSKEKSSSSPEAKSSSSPEAEYSSNSEAKSSSSRETEPSSSSGTQKKRKEAK